jgi:6-phosphofructokinase 1
MGLRGRGIEKVPIEEAFAEMDTESGRPKHQWYLDLKEAADALARGY